MKCKICDRIAEFVVESDEVHVVCGRHANSFYGRTIPIGDYAEVRSALDEAERIIGALVSGKIVKSVHPYHPEVHWTMFNAGKILNRAVDSSSGKVFPVAVDRDLQASFEQITRAILNGWLCFVIEPKSHGWTDLLVKTITREVSEDGRSKERS